MKCQKDLFSLEEGSHYLNCGYKAPLLKNSEAAAIEALIRERDPSSIKPADFFADLSIVKNSFAGIIQCNAYEVAIIPSASFGLSTALKNVKPKKAGFTLTVSDEFPSGYFALKRWCDENSNDLVVVKPKSTVNKGRTWNETLLEQITERTSVVLISSIHWMSGIKYDLEAIGQKCFETGTLFIVDGTQSVGALQMDVKKFKINALVCAGYKWLMGPYSLALAYFDENFHHGTPLEESWMNRINAHEFSRLTQYEEEYLEGAGRFNVGETSNFILMPMLKASLAQIAEWKPENIQQYCKELIQPLLSYLKHLGVEPEEEAFFSNHLFALNLPKEIDREKLTQLLLQNKVYVSVRGEFLRISVNVFNDEKDIEKLIETIESARVAD